MLHYSLETMALIYQPYIRQKTVLTAIFHARINIYPSGRDRFIRSSLKSGLTLCTQVRVSVDLWFSTDKA